MVLSLLNSDCYGDRVVAIELLSAILVDCKETVNVFEKLGGEEILCLKLSSFEEQDR